MKPKLNQQAVDILEYLNANPDSSISDIAAALEVRRATVEYNVNRMADRGMIYVSSYRVPQFLGSTERLFTAGKGVDKPYPYKSKEQMREPKRRYDQRRSLIRKLTKAGESMGPFRIFAQVMQ